MAIGLVVIAAASCGGKVDLTFTGAPATAGGTDSTGGTDSGAGMGNNGGEGNAPATSCGDGTVDPGEECDDGAHAVGDGCDADCKIEEGYTCTGSPSACVKCGNGKVEAGEECDDGNSDAGDGCSADCKIEGSCATPLPIALKATKDGLAGSATATTAVGDAGQVDAAVCGGTVKIGGGADRIFEVDLAGAADLEITVGASFDAVVRVMSSPCDLTSELSNGCVDDAGVAGTEHVVLNDTPAGKYYIVVDGKTVKQAGDFTVNVVARCPLGGLKINRVMLQEPFRTVLLNTNQDCAIDLSRVGIYAQPEANDSPKTLPAATLDALKFRVLTSESPPPSGTIYQGNIRYDLEDYAGAFYLCRGECDTANGSNVIDALHWAGTSGALSVAAPKTVVFDKDLPALTDRLAMSYYRVTYDNAYPNFSNKNFVGAFFVENFEDGTLGGWDAPTALFYKADLAKVDGTVGNFSLSLTGGNPAQAVWNGPRHTFTNNLGAAAPITPSYVSYRVLGSDKTLSHGWTFFGRQGAEVSGFGSFFRDNGTLGFGAPAPTIALPYTVNTWYQVEYKNFTATDVDVYVDGKLKTPKLPIGSTTVAQIALRNVAADAKFALSFGIDQIIVQ